MQILSLRKACDNIVFHEAIFINIENITITKYQIIINFSNNTINKGINPTTNKTTKSIMKIIP